MKYLICFLFAMAISLGVLAYVYGHGSHEECQNLEILNVGGCTVSGSCGVMYSDHSYGARPYPTIGEIVKVCKTVPNK